MTKRTHQFGSVTVEAYYPPAPSRVVTTFADGSVLEAVPHDTADYSDRAASLGYDSADDMNREHDVLHSYLADALGWPCSPTLYAAAHNEEIPREQADREEACVLAFARYMNTGVADMDRLLPLVDAGLDLAELREEAIRRLR